MAAVSLRRTVDFPELVLWWCDVGLHGLCTSGGCTVHTCPASNMPGLLLCPTAVPHSCSCQCPHSEGGVISQCYEKPYSYGWPLTNPKCWHNLSLNFGEETNQIQLKFCHIESLLLFLSVKSDTQRLIKQCEEQWNSIEILAFCFQYEIAFLSKVCQEI